MHPWEQVRAVLAEAKAEGKTWDQAWSQMMRALFTPPRGGDRLDSGYDPHLRAAMDEDRSLLREVKPWLKAAYEDAEVELSEFERASLEAEKRLDGLMAAA